MKNLLILFLVALFLWSCKCSQVKEPTTTIGIPPDQYKTSKDTIARNDYSQIPIPTTINIPTIKTSSIYYRPPAPTSIRPIPTSIYRQPSPPRPPNIPSIPKMPKIR